MRRALVALWVALASLAPCGCGTSTKRPPSGKPGDAADAGATALTGPETACANCHPNHVAEWKSSSHAYAMKDPVFHAMVRLGQKETEGALDDFCVKCHSPIGNATGQTVVSKDPKTGFFVQQTEGLKTDAMDGVSCLVCHSMTKVNTVADADFDMDLSNVRHGPISDPDVSTAHETAYSALYEDTEMCGTCHVVVNQKKIPLEETHQEWVASGFNGQKSCQDCHMPSHVGAAAEGHREDRKVHEHRFVGVDVPLVPDDEFPGGDDARARATTLLQNAVNFRVTAETGAPRLDIDIENLAGHALPSGATADREMWVELVVKDVAGNTAFESGTLDERGDLRVDDADRTTRPGTDPALILYTQRMLVDPKVDDPTSTAAPTVADFLWQPNTLPQSDLIHPEETAHRNYDLSTLPPGAYTATARLLFRTFPPHLLRKLEAEASLDPAVKDRVPTVEMASKTVTLSR